MKNAEWKARSAEIPAENIPTNFRASVLVAPGTLRKLRHVTGVLQVEITELLVAVNNYSATMLRP